MKVNLQQVLKGLDGKPLKNEEGKEVNLEKVCVGALTNMLPTEQATGEVKFKRFQLAQKISGQKEVELTIEEVAMIKERVGVLHSPLVLGITYQMLEGKKE